MVHNPGRGLPYKSDCCGDGRQFWKEPLKGTRILFCGCGSNFFSAQMTVWYFFYFWLYTLNVAMITLTVVILDLNTLSGTKPRIWTPKRNDDHPRHFYMRISCLITTSQSFDLLCYYYYPFCCSLQITATAMKMRNAKATAKTTIGITGIKRRWI